MPLDWRVFSLAKDAEHPDENQDACRIDGGRGIAVIADGVASGIFSRLWARILTEAAVAGPPDPDDREALAAWLAECRRQWSSGIDVANLAWFQKPKMRQGAFSTLLWVRLRPAADPADADAPPLGVHAWAIGDSCLLHVREGQILQTFPIQASAELEADPAALGSLDLGRDHLLAFAKLEADCRLGDLIVLCTDAVAHWALRQREAGLAIEWDRYWEMTEPEWRDQIAALRTRQQMRYDDATLAVLRVTDKMVGPETYQGPAQPDRVRAGGTAAAPPPIPVDLAPRHGAPSQQDWKARLKSLSEEFSQQVGQQWARGLEQLKKARHSAEEALRRYREKLRSKEDEDKPDKGA